MVFAGIMIFIPAAVVQDATFLKCAAVLYLWGAVAALRAMFVFSQKMMGMMPSKKDYALAFVGGIYASSFEQAAAFLVVYFVFVLGYMIYKRIRIGKADVILTAVVCVLSLFFFSLPGNSVRSKAEVLNRMSNFEHFTLFQKIFWGMEFGIQSVNTLFPIAAFFRFGLETI